MSSRILLYETNISSSKISFGSPIATATHYSFLFKWTGTLLGSVFIEVSPNGEDWVQLTGSIQSTAGTPGTHTVNVSNAGYQCARGVYSHSSGSGDLTVTTYIKSHR